MKMTVALVLLALCLLSAAAAAQVSEPAIRINMMTIGFGQAAVKIMQPGGHTIHDSKLCCCLLFKCCFKFETQLTATSVKSPGRRQLALV